MSKAGLYNAAGDRVKEIDLDPAVFAVKPNESLVHQAVTARNAAARSGTASTKTRSEVRGGGRKPWRQKGTGRARAGSRRSPLWNGGGVTFGPKPRDYSQAMPRKMRRQAYRSILSAKAASGSIQIIEGFEFESPSTSKASSLLDKLASGSKVTVILSDDNLAARSFRNLGRARVMEATLIDPVALLDNEGLLMTQAALSTITEALS